MIAVFDTETTGVNVEEDRIVTAFFGMMDDEGNFTKGGSWLINPGVEIPAEASAVHGITTERAQAEGMNPLDAITDIIHVIGTLLGDLPLVIYNAPFDLTILDRESRRHLGRPLDVPKLVIDPLVIDKATDKYRKGSRKLTAVAPVYGVPVEEDAHDAQADCKMAGRIALKMLESNSAEYYHGLSAEWKAEQAASLQTYLRKSDPSAIVDPSWPIKGWRA